MWKICNDDNGDIFNSHSLNSTSPSSVARDHDESIDSEFFMAQQDAKDRQSNKHWSQAEWEIK